MAGMVEHATTVTAIKSIVELPNGRVVVADPSENRLVVLDFKTGTARDLGRAGEGPREFKAPGGVYPALKGGAVLYDQNLRRFLPVLPDGTVGDAIALPFKVTSMSSSTGEPDQFVPDTLGGFVTVNKSSFIPGVGTSTLTRIGSDGVSTALTTLQQAQIRELPSDDPQVRRTQMILFSPVDIWALAPDGWTAVVSAAPYRVRWFPPTGTPRDGPTLPFTPLPVTKADRDAVLTGNGSPSRLPQLGSTGSNGRTVTPARSTPLFADAKPPFAMQIPRMDRAGRIWIARHVPHGEGPVYDVIDRRGVVVDRLRIPKATQVIGFGSKALYLLRLDEDDVGHLQQVPWR
ncbi:MAG: hypothetical protein SFU84_15090 [Gemmatimonadales bacterium]|nr:hypothetical protein [Gemmatimonadales bacterium]